MPNGKDDSALDDFSADFPVANDKDLEADFPASDPGNLDNDLDNPPQEPQERQQPAEPREPRRNRHHRRLEAKLQGERESNILLAAKLEALTEAAKFRQEVGGSSVDERLITLYGNDENGRKAAQITQSLLEDTAKRARADALEDFRASQREREQKIRETQEFVDTELEDLEDSNGIDFTSDSPQARKNRSEFLDMVTKFSPKEEDGTIADFADFKEVFDVFQQTRKSGNTTRQKDLASRGMVRGGGGAPMAQDKASEKYLRDTGII